MTPDTTFRKGPIADFFLRLTQRLVKIADTEEARHSPFGLRSTDLSKEYR
jgi:hypothetical protein